MDIDEYQRLSRETDHIVRRDINYLVPLLGLNEHIGLLTAILRRELCNPDQYTAFMDEVTEELGKVYWYLSTITSDLDLSSGEVLKKNVEFNRGRWPSGEANSSVYRFDGGFPENEQLPRQFTIEFECVTVDDGVTILKKVRPHVPGLSEAELNEIDDNFGKDDGYRFHDTMHMASATFLGWSPVLRGLFKRKRKSQPEIDRIQDGARARDTEEAITRMIHARAAAYNYFQSKDVTIETQLLGLVREMTRGLEAESCRAKDWERAIREAYRMRGLIMEHNGGGVTANLDTQTLVFTPPQAK